jgi:hypothetical protein
MAGRSLDNINNFYEELSLVLMANASSWPASPGEIRHQDRSEAT